MSKLEQLNLDPCSQTMVPHIGSRKFLTPWPEGAESLEPRKNEGGETRERKTSSEKKREGAQCGRGVVEQKTDSTSNNSYGEEAFGGRGSMS